MNKKNQRTRILNKIQTLLLKKSLIHGRIQMLISQLQEIEKESSNSKAL